MREHSYDCAIAKLSCLVHFAYVYIHKASDSTVMLSMYNYRDGGNTLVIQSLRLDHIPKREAYRGRVPRIYIPGILGLKRYSGILTAHDRTRPFPLSLVEKYILQQYGIV